jgi:hypothetical protein
MDDAGRLFKQRSDRESKAWQNILDDQNAATSEHHRRLMWPMNYDCTPPRLDFDNYWCSVSQVRGDLSVDGASSVGWRDDFDGDIRSKFEEANPFPRRR